MHILAKLLAVAAIGFLILLIRPQLALRVGNTVPTRGKLLIPFFTCWILTAVVSHAARLSGDSENLQSPAGSESASVVRASYVSPERQELAARFVQIKKMADLSDSGGLPEQQHPGCYASLVQLARLTDHLGDAIQTRLNMLRRSNAADPENDPSMSPIYESDAQMLDQPIRNAQLICGM